MITDFEDILFVDAAGERLKMARRGANGRIAAALTNAAAMEDFFEALIQIAPDPAQIEAFALCTGTGSILGTRVASVGISTVAKFSGAKIFEWNCMGVAAFALADAGNKRFSLFTPSRKGFANILNFDGKPLELKEIETGKIAAEAFDKKFSLYQKTKTDPIFSTFERFDLDEKTALETILKYPHLACECCDTPDAKPLTEREYVKWKGQAHI